MTDRYVLVPGYVLSKNDDDRHHVSFDRLRRLYALRLQQCYYSGDYPKLYPRYDGKYVVDGKPNLKRCIVWRTSYDQYMCVEDMRTAHIWNCLAMLSDGRRKLLGPQWLRMVEVLKERHAEHMTSSVICVARAGHQEILADALEDAGYSDERMLAQLREGKLTDLQMKVFQ